MHSVPDPPTSHSKPITQPNHSPQSSELAVSPLLGPKSASLPSSHKPKPSRIPHRMSHPPPNLEPPSSPNAVLDSLVQQSSEQPPSPSLVGHESPAAPPPDLDGNATHPPVRKHPVSSPPALLSPRTLPPPPSPPLSVVQNMDPLLSPMLKPPESPPPPQLFSPPPPMEPPPPSPPPPEISPPLPVPMVQTAPPPPQTLVPSPNTSVVSVPSLALPPPSGSPPIVSTPSVSPNPPHPPSPPPHPYPPPSHHLFSVVPPSSLTPNVSSTHEPAVPSTNHSNSNTPQNALSRNSREFSTGDIVAVALVLGFVFLGLSGSVAFCVWKRKKKVLQYYASYFMPKRADSSLMNVKVSRNNVNGPVKGSIFSSHESGGFGNSKSFPYEVLAEATGGFSEMNLLGVGGFGSVYKGILADGTTVAVKQLKLGGGQGEREFRAEVEIISRIHHRHLVSLVGYCIDENRRLLVYDYVPNNNLYYHLHGEGLHVLEWTKRVKIAIGSAHGIAYLHEDCHPRVIHRDIKSLNILLDNCFEAQVSDFGLAKLAMDAKTHVTTRVVGTFGYMAPEYASSGKLTEKSDVFSFGVVLLELITGRKPVDASQPAGDESLVEWARPLLKHVLENKEFEMVADPRLEKQYVDSEMFRMIEAAAACVRHSSLKRPKMGQVVRALDNMTSMDLSNGMKVGESGFFSEEVTLLQKMAFGPQDNSSDFFRQDSESELVNYFGGRR